MRGVCPARVSQDVGSGKRGKCDALGCWCRKDRPGRQQKQDNTKCKCFYFATWSTHTKEQVSVRFRRGCTLLILCCLLAPGPASPWHFLPRVGILRRWGPFLLQQIGQCVFVLLSKMRSEGTASSIAAALPIPGYWPIWSKKRKKDEFYQSELLCYINRAAPQCENWSFRGCNRWKYLDNRPC